MIVTIKGSIDVCIWSAWLGHLYDKGLWKLIVKPSVSDFHFPQSLKLRLVGYSRYSVPYLIQAVSDSAVSDGVLTD